MAIKCDVWQRALLVLLLAICAYLPSSSSFGVPLSLEAVIVLDGQKMSEDNRAAYQAKWVKGCNIIGDLITAKENDIGKGVFASVRCIDEPVTDGYAEYEKSIASSWLVKVTDRSTTSGVELFFKSKNRWILEASYFISTVNQIRGAQPESENVVLSGIRDGTNSVIGAINSGTDMLAGALNLGSDRFLTALNDRQLVQHLVQLLLDQMPFYSSLTLRLDEKVKSVTGPNIPTPSVEEYTIYELEFDSERELWQPRPVGLAKFKACKDSECSWDIDLHKGVIKENVRYFLQDSRGRSKNRDHIDSLLQQDLKKYGLSTFVDMLLSSFDSNFIGIRYGYSLSGVDSVISQAGLISSFFEMRSGLLAGLRFYYDAAPLSTKMYTDPYSEDNLKEEFSWSRISVGWSFNLGVPTLFSGLVDRFDLAAKFGKLKMSTKFIVKDEYDDNLLVRFDTTGTMGGGAELGVERHFSNGFLRGWVSYDQAGLAVSNSDVIFSSMRAGADLYRDIYVFGDKTKVRGLLFGLSEWITLAQSDEQLAKPRDTITISPLEYKLNFIGLGASLSW